MVDRAAGPARARCSEQELKDAGILRKEQLHRGRRASGYEAQYTLTPSLTFSEQDAGPRAWPGVIAMIPGTARHRRPGRPWWSRSSSRKHRRHLLLSDNETTEQVAAATGSARTTDLGVGGLVFGKLGGAAGAGWSNTNEGKVIAAAFLDAHNQLVVQARALQAKELPPPVPTIRTAAGSRRHRKAGRCSGT